MYVRILINPMILSWNEIARRGTCDTKTYSHLFVVVSLVCMWDIGIPKEASKLSLGQWTENGKESCGKQGTPVGEIWVSVLIAKQPPEITSPVHCPPLGERKPRHKLQGEQQGESRGGWPSEDPSYTTPGTVKMRSERIRNPNASKGSDELYFGSCSGPESTFDHHQEATLALTSLHLIVFFKTFQHHVP